MAYTAATFEAHEIGAPHRREN